MRIVPTAVAVLLIALVCAGPRVARAGAPVWRLQSQASEAADAGKYSRADKLYQKARRKAPEDAYLAMDHATLLARDGRIDEALAALAAALDHGYRHPKSLRESEALEPLRDKPEWDAWVERAAENQVEFEGQLREARTPIDPAEAQPFEDLASLLEAKAAAEQSLYAGTNEVPWQIRQARFVEHWAAALTRLANVKEAADSDREGARIEIVRLRVNDAESMDLRWTADSIEKVADAAGRYLEAFPGSENEGEARLALAVARTVALQPEDFEQPEESWPQPRCEETLPELERLGSLDPPDLWSLSAQGFMALCLAATDSDNHESIRQAAAAYLNSEETEVGVYDLTLRGLLKIALWRIDGLPEFEAEALAGGTLTLADLRGRVTLLDFWNPG